METVYILVSEELGRFYIGYTANLENRLEFHLNSASRKFTYNANDWIVFLKIGCETKQQALKIEKHIKQMKSKVYIQNLKRYPGMIEKLLSKYQDC